MGRWGEENLRMWLSLKKVFSSEHCWVEIYLALVTSILNYLLFSFYKGRREQNITQLSGYRAVLLSRVK